MAVLDIRTTQTLTIKSDAGKNFSVTIAGFDNLDTDYTLQLNAQDSTITKTVGDGITLGVNEMVIAFYGDEFTKTRYTGELNSESQDADVFLRIDTIVELS
jgi:hypothetical protein